MRAPSFFTGYEDFEEPNEEPSRSDESDVSDNEAISGDLPTAAVPDNQPPQPVIVHGTVSLQNIVADEDINKDAKFLDDINKVINDADTSQIFLPQMQNCAKPITMAGKVFESVLSRSQCFFRLSQIKKSDLLQKQFF